MKNRRALLFFGLAALCGLATASAARRDDDGPKGRPVVVAAAAVSLGSLVEPTVVDVVYMPDAAVPQGAFRSAASLTGRVLGRSLVKGEPVLESALLPEGSEAGLSALIEKNARAVAIEVDPYVGVGGFVQPGSRVDVLATQKRGSDRRTDVLLENLRVLAVDVRVDEGDGKPTEAKVVTLEVSAGQSAMLAHAAHEGTLKLALRNPSDDSDARPVEMVLGTDVHHVRY